MSCPAGAEGPRLRQQLAPAKVYPPLAPRAPLRSHGGQRFTVVFWGSALFAIRIRPRHQVRCAVLSVDENFVGHQPGNSQDTRPALVFSRISEISSNPVTPPRKNPLRCKGLKDHRVYWIKFELTSRATLAHPASFSNRPCCVDCIHPCIRLGVPCRVITLYFAMVSVPAPGQTSYGFRSRPHRHRLVRQRLRSLTLPRRLTAVNGIGSRRCVLHPHTDKVKDNKRTENRQTNRNGLRSE
jgi:hypothetical protein